MRFHPKIIISLAACLFLSACSKLQRMDTVAYVDIERFMGDWYVIANIPTFIEKHAHNAKENYRLNKDGTIATTFSFHDNDFDGELNQYYPTGYILDRSTNALWGMQFIWPIKADYRIVYLDSDYQNTIIARQARDYVWIMSRRPVMDEAKYQELKNFVGLLGYDTNQLQKVPQRWEKLRAGERL